MIDKGKVKKFAVNARRTLIEDIKLRLRQIGIDENGIADKLPESTAEIEYYSKTLGTELTGSKIFWRQDLVKILNRRKKKTDWETALQDTIEEVAYTWFNRIIAIRFMEVNDYLPSRTRVLSSEEGRNQPDIMFHALELEADLGKYTPEERSLIKRAQETNKPADMDAMYSMLFIKQADALRQDLPYLFEKTSDYMKLLFTPRYSNGVIKDLITQIPESYFDIEQEGQVEIIGWLYQYYNTEPHEKVVNIVGGPVKKSEIPAATQLFTTDWIVRYMVDNSLGKYYLERHPNNHLKSRLKYLLPDEIKNVNDERPLTEYKFIDNAMGSGHILVYAYDLLIEMYHEQGYSEREAAKLIIQNNLYGLDIDKRAYQLTFFALMMKFRQYDRRALSYNIYPNVYPTEDCDDLSSKFFEKLRRKNADLTKQLEDILADFANVEEYGSIIKLPKNVDYQKLNDFVASLEITTALDLDKIRYSKEKVLKVFKLINILNNKYDIVVTNPPYLNKFDPTLKKYLKQHYSEYSKDLFSVFVHHNINLVKENGYAAFMTPMVWMFIKSYEPLRSDIINNKRISSLIQLEYSAYDEATVPICTFVIQNNHKDRPGVYLRLADFKGGMEVQRQKVLAAIENPNVKYVYRPKQTNFSKIPGNPIAYWSSKNLIHDFEIGTSMDKIVDTKVGLQTGDNNKFLRQWFEVAINNICFNAKSLQESLESRKKWFPYNKGGSYRKWYGNYDYVVNWENNGQEIRNFKDNNGKLRSRPQNTDYYFREAITWSLITSSGFSMRYRNFGSIHDVSGMSAFSDNHDILLLVMATENSKVGNYILKVLNPTINLQVGDLKRFPIIKSKSTLSRIILPLVKSSKQDWDSFETSWDFKHHPLLNHIAEHKQNWSLKAAYDQWAKEALDRFNQLKSNEEELNRIFIDLYGLQNELTSEEDDKDVTVRKADKERDIKSLLSYFVGCVFGRYSLDIEGLAYAGGQWNDDNYRSFKPNKDNLILLMDKDYFGDQRDIINRLQQFLIVIFGKKNLSDNLNVIAEALNSKKLQRGIKAKDIIREYFIKGFYKDHCKIYQKRPIYWEINSGRNNGFKALFYLHRYDQNAMSIAREKLHELQNYYESNQKADKQQLLIEKDKKVIKQLKKEVEQLNKKLDEIIKFDTPLQHIAGEKIEIDLDDGVLINHQKVQGKEKLLSKI
ncbi:BREX-1 system adenine-specific DNA-methyltransferase PglX [Liquorilactobacillus vini]|uniref:BREX-1 system adenine-specific DNA-methyltransferase PglX n=1 Tax=Liquorilactobacillus vini TaxID=238015 RepID=UPI0003077A8F|nr:BREX-1 system adenine-specific DNA-methyltransferase PglX [Liquorilactobacillus vini]